MKNIHDMDTDKHPVPGVYLAPTIYMSSKPLPKAELLRRLVQITDNVKNERMYNTDPYNRPIKLIAANALRSSLTQLMTYINDKEIRYQLNELIALTVDITGV